jgi:hypothetical protein
MLTVIISQTLGLGGDAALQHFSMFPAYANEVASAWSSAPNLNETAELIVRGTIASIESQFSNGTVLSRAVVSVESVEKGVPISKIIVEYEGGTVGDIALVVSNQARFRVGEHVLLYLVRGTGDNFKVAGGPAGKILLDSSGRVLATAESGYIYTGLHWPSGNVGYYVNTAGGPSGALSAVQAGFQVWNTAGAAFSFAYGGGGNAVHWAYIDGPGHTLAVTYVWSSSYIVYSCETVFDTAESWATDGSPNKLDVQNVAAHEAGHWLVLDDLYQSQYSEMTMYGYASRGEIKKRTLEWGDIAGIRFIYGSLPPTPPPFGFSLSNSASITATQGDSGSNMITTTLTNGQSQSVSLSCTSDLPSEASCSFNPASGFPPFSTTLTISTSALTPSGWSTITVAGVGGGVSRTTTFTLVVNPPGQQVVDSFIRGPDNRIYYGGSITGTWSGWIGLPGSTRDSPAATTCGGMVHVAVRGGDDGIYYGNVTLSTSVFSGWNKLPGSTPSAPALAAASDCTLYLAVRGSDNGIYLNVRTGPSWGGWQKLLGVTVDGPAVTVAGSVLHFAVRGGDGSSIWHGRMNRGTMQWLGWSNLPGSTPSKPALAAASETEVCLAVKGSDNRIYVNKWDGAAWAGWSMIPTGSTPSGPSVTIANVQLYLAVRGMDNGIYWCTESLSIPGWSDWARLPDSTASSPGLAS